MTNVSLVPISGGVENYEFSEGAVTARAGSGFNPDNPQHRASDAVRYAIAIQEARDQGDYSTSDARAAKVRSYGYSVGTGKGITVITRPAGRTPSTLVEGKGLIYDNGIAS